MWKPSGQNKSKYSWPFWNVFEMRRWRSLRRRPKGDRSQAGITVKTSVWFARHHVQRPDNTTLILLMLANIVKKEQIMTSDTRDENVGEEKVIVYLRCPCCAELLYSFCYKAWMLWLIEGYIYGLFQVLSEIQSKTNLFPSKLCKKKRITCSIICLLVEQNQTQYQDPAV